MCSSVSADLSPVGVPESPPTLEMVHMGHQISFDIKGIGESTQPFLLITPKMGS